MQTIHSSGENLLSLLNEVLDLSKIDAGALSLDSIPFSPREVFADIVSLHMPRANAAGLNLEVDIADSLPAQLTGDPTRLRQIIVNYVSNAIKFTASGTVRFLVRWQPLGEDSGRLTAEVADTGIGKTEEQLVKLFRPFQQADESTPRRFGGTGQGLAICRELAHRMHGEVGCLTGPAQGSTFWISLTLPVVARKEKVKRRPKLLLETSTLRDLRVLLAEDNPVNREVALAWLQRAGCQVQVAKTGLEATQLFAAQPFDLILMDCHMPEMDGYAATAAIRQAPNGARIPIIAITANALTGERNECLAAGMNDYVAKPFRPEDLIRTLEKWAGGVPV